MRGTPLLTILAPVLCPPAQATNNVIDFSMLVGVDEDKKELVLGLVDAIGAYTVFKALESKGKLLANKGGDVTVVRSSLALTPLPRLSPR